MARTELGDFLRTRRQRLKPEDVGLPAGPRRRTPGLRREEVATLAGLSVDYLVRLEQGRDRNPSMAVVSALAGALRLDADERLHLKMLAGCASSPDSCPQADAVVDDVPATVLALLDRLDPTPAVLIGPWYQVLASNDTWCRIMAPVGVLDSPSPNLARFTFLDPRSRAVYPAWDEVADEQVAVLRQAIVRWRSEPRLQAFVDELLEVPEFAARWRCHEVARKRRGTKLVRHPELGDLHVEYEVLSLDDAERRIVTWLPADEATEAAFRHVAGATLRVVGD